MRIVARKQEEFRSIARDESLADFAARFGADGDVLQVRVRRREAASGGDELVEMGVNAPRLRDDVGRQRVEISGLQLARFPPTENVGNDRVFAFERGERLLVGFVLAGFGLLRLAGERKMVEQNFA